MDLLPLSCVHIFDSSGSETFDIEALAAYGKDLFRGLDVEFHGDLVEFCTGSHEHPDAERLKKELAVRLAQARVTDPYSRHENAVHPKPIVDYERRMLDREPPRPVGIFYDGFDLCTAYNMVLSNAGVPSDSLVVVVTNQLFGTCDEGDGRYHARVIILGSPCIISISGLVEAPARPREHYLGQQLGFGKLDPQEDMPEKWLRRDDPRTTEVLKGYLAQTVFYQLTGEPFCEERGCRLFNAHWQEDLLYSQLDGAGEFCPYHEQMLARLTGAIDG